MTKRRSTGFRFHSLSRHLAGGLSRRLAGLLPVTLVIPVMLVLTSGSRATASSLGIVIGQPCPDVMVIAARGSGEQPQAYDPADGGPYHGNWTEPAAYLSADTYYGVGSANYEVYRALSRAARNLRISLDPVQYPADPSPDSLISNFAFSHVSEKSAAATIVSQVDRTERACGGRVRYVLAGSSQGAWAVHEALWQLAKRSPGTLGKIAGVSLLGDPLFVPGQTIVRDDNAKTLVWSGVATGVVRTFRDVPQTLRSVTGSYCLTNDPICQDVKGLKDLPALPACALVAWARGDCPQTSYRLWGETAKAAGFLASSLVPKEVRSQPAGSTPYRVSSAAAFSGAPTTPWKTATAHSGTATTHSGTIARITEKPTPPVHSSVPPARPPGDSGASGTDTHRVGQAQPSDPAPARALDPGRHRGSDSSHSRDAKRRPPHRVARKQPQNLRQRKAAQRTAAGRHHRAAGSERGQRNAGGHHHP